MTTTEPEDPNPAASEPVEIAPSPDDAPPPEEPPGNVDDDGVAHYCRMFPDGTDECGSCHTPWPCEKARHLLVLPLDALE